MLFLFLRRGEAAATCMICARFRWKFDFVYGWRDEGNRDNLM
jgi:hypothetical protein